jgi:hypothetical protein
VTESALWRFFLADDACLKVREENMSFVRVNLVLVLLIAAPLVAADGEKVLVCHATGSAEKPFVQIEVSQNAADAHLTGHPGDHAGTAGAPCGGPQTPRCVVAAVSAAPTTVSCGMVITVDTVLEGDVGPCSGDGVIIGVDNVTFDLNGHRILGQEPTAGGIRVDGRTGVVIQNGTVRDFSVGITMLGGSSNLVTAMTVVGNQSTMIRHLYGVREQHHLPNHHHWKHQHGGRDFWWDHCPCWRQQSLAAEHHQREFNRYWHSDIS